MQLTVSFSCVHTLSGEMVLHYPIMGEGGILCTLAAPVGAEAHEVFYRIHDVVDVR